MPIFCPAFTDSSAGFGLVMHQEQNPKKHITIDSIRELRELTEIKIKSKQSGLLNDWRRRSKKFYSRYSCMCRFIGKKVDMHKYAIQITVADTRDGACSSSTLKEASSWGKVDITKEQMVFAEATSVLPLIASDAYHRKIGKKEKEEIFLIILNLLMDYLSQKKGFLVMRQNLKLKIKYCCSFRLRKNCKLWWRNKKWTKRNY